MIPTNVELDMVFGSSIMTFRTAAKRPFPIARAKKDQKPYCKLLDTAAIKTGVRTQ